MCRFLAKSEFCMIWSILSTQIALKPLPIDSPDSGIELKKKSHRKIFFRHGEK